jgi:proteic killer suppression protein
MHDQIFPAQRPSRLLRNRLNARNPQRPCETSGAHDLDMPGWRLHPLKGELVGYWSLTVSGNWRVIFRFIGSDIELVDYLDYH